MPSPAFSDPDTEMRMWVAAFVSSPPLMSSCAQISFHSRYPPLEELSFAVVAEAYRVPLERSF